MNKLSHEEYLQELNSKGIKIKPLETYAGRNKKILHLCVCGKEWLTSPNTVLSGRHCNKCKSEILSKLHYKSKETYLEELNKRNIPYIPLEDYKGAKIPIPHKCPMGHVWNAMPSNILAGRGCRECRTINNAKRATLTHEQFIERYKDKLNQNVRILSRYQGNRQKIECECLLCGNIYNVTPASLILGHGCKECSDRKNGDKRRFSNEEYVQRLLSANSSIKALENYVGMNTPILHKCLMCNYEWKVIPSSLLYQKSGCPKCTGTLVSHNDFMLRLKEVKNPNVIILGTYKTMNTDIPCVCAKCGYSWSANPQVLLRGGGCRKCADIEWGEKHRRTPEEFNEEFYKIHPTLKLLSTYVTAKTKVKCQCLICNYVWEVTPDSLLGQNTGCPVCSSSKGERRIFAILHQNDIEFIAQQTFPDLFGVNGGLLSYDFYLPSYDILIEYQGEQHKFARGGVFGGEEQFKIQQEHDKRKREYAKSHSINLLEIWYYDYDNIEQILTEYLNLNSESVETVTDV